MMALPSDVTAEMVARAALPWAYESLRIFAPEDVPNDDGVAFRGFLRRLGGPLAFAGYELADEEFEHLARRRARAQQEALDNDPDVLRRRADRRAMDALRPLVYARDGYRCVYCGAEEGLSLDHIIPFSRGGEATLANLQTLCQPCNSRKGMT